MRYAVIIDLDYVNNPYEVCKAIWVTIRDEMLKQGFYPDGRRFVISAPKDEACRRARAAMELVEARLEHLEKCLPNYLKTFYGFRLDCVVSLLVASADDIQVQEPEQ
ncbi:MAG: hypothetical protein A2150_02050 [Candidatus Muproteobacteria bacterium RBG_16_64_11]|uniref:CRISPR-associated protein Cas2 n=1 Tax=Candidatus Muproteobacteria bacterium RBG_16_64_11 TaxID=1817758 RepID=A0A1F6T939_9PROT|nr:MAG: hypothetical protein A2150_02050 [Candidatus Muproteobacteria bacterium RBG_16_64_11]